jgi:hypothetical protein
MKTVLLSILIFTFAGIAQTFNNNGLYSIDSALVAFYPFNGNANDQSGNNNNGIVIGASLTTDRFGNTNNAYQFNGTSDNITVVDNLTLNLTNEITLAAWVKRTRYGIDMIMEKGGDWTHGTCNYGMSLHSMNNNMFYFFFNGGWRGTGGVNDFEWHHYTVIAQQGNTNPLLYIDGELKQVQYSEGAAIINLATSTLDLHIGAQVGTATYYGANVIDEVRIYNRTLSQTEISQLAGNGLVAFYPFNGNANDESGSGNNGTVNGAALTQDRFGVNGQAFSFDGIDDHITIADNPNLFSDELTISWWYKMTEILGGERVVIGWVDGGHRYQQFFNGGQLSYLNGYNVAQPGMYFNPIYGLNDLNVWKNVVVTYKKLTETTSTSSIYVDGELKQTDNHNLAMDYVPGINFLIGKNHNGNYFKGFLDDMRIYNRILDSTEIVALYNDSTTYNPPAISSVYPHQNSNYFQKDETIKVFFTQPMNLSSISNYQVYISGNLTGKYLADVSYQSATNSLEIKPTTTLKYGELISVTLDSMIQTAAGNNITSYVFQFNVKPEKGTVKFAAADSFQLNFQPTSIINGDFNNDGKVDVIVSNYDSLKYTIALNNGVGGFTLGEEMTGEFKPYSISFTDIDNDRDLDMIISTNEENKIRVLKGTGQGIFSWILPTIDVNGPVATCPGDFDGDGDNDFVALVNYGLFDGRAYLYKNDGTGSFTHSGYVNIGFPASQRNVVGDFDNDGDLDLVVGQSEYSAIIRTLINDGSGNFVYYSGTNLGAYPDEIAGGDFDGDYDLDVIHCAWYANGLGIMLNDSTGSFTSDLNLGNVGGQSRNPVANDFDGDGDLDFVVTFNSNNVGIVKNNGHPNYELNLSYPISGLKGITAADFDNNGSVDIVGISSTTNQIKFLKNCVDSLVAYYPFSNNTNDYSGNINDGINYNGVYSKDRYGFDNSSMYFNGVDSYVEGINPGNNLPVGDSPRTISVWVKSFEASNDRNIFHYGYDVPAATNYHLYLTSGRFAGIGNGWGYGLLNSTTDIGDTTWHYLTAVYEGGSTNFHKIFIDGKIDTLGIISTVPNTTLTSNWKIGRFMGGGQSLLGSIDELMVFNIALSDQQIWDMYKSTTTAPTLVAPLNNSATNTLTPLLDWDSTVAATSYKLVVSTDSTFTTTMLGQDLASSDYQIQSGLLTDNTKYYWKVRTINEGGVGPWSETSSFTITTTGVEDEKQLPTEYALLQNYPNPFNPTTTIHFDLPEQTKVVLKIYNILGHEVRTLVSGVVDVGYHSYIWDGKNQSGKDVSSGIYLYRIETDKFSNTMKLLLTR